MELEGPNSLERSLLLHILEHRGHQVRFEADQWTTEFGIFRAFNQEDQTILKNALRGLEMSRLIYRRIQYVIGYSEPKLVFSLTPVGHRKALDLQRAGGNGTPVAEAAPHPPDDGPGMTIPPTLDDSGSGA